MSAHLAEVHEVTEEKRFKIMSDTVCFLSFLLLAASTVALRPHDVASTLALRPRDQRLPKRCFVSRCLKQPMLNTRQFRSGLSMTTYVFSTYVMREIENS